MQGYSYIVFHSEAFLQKFSFESTYFIVLLFVSGLEHHTSFAYHDQTICAMDSNKKNQTQTLIPTILLVMTYNVSQKPRLSVEVLFSPRENQSGS